MSTGKRDSPYDKEERGRNDHWDWQIPEEDTDLPYAGAFS